MIFNSIKFVMTKIRANRVIERRSQLGLSQADLADRIGISQQAVNQLEKGETQRPRKLREIAVALECTEDWLLGGSGKPQPPKGVGLISWVQAGALAEVIDSYQPGDAEMWIDYPAKHSKMIALRVKGNSMNKISPDGSIIIIDLNDREMTSNRLYVVKIGDDATFKRFRNNPPRLVPETTGDFKTIFLGDRPVRPVGRVVRTMIDFD